MLNFKFRPKVGNSGYFRLSGSEQTITFRVWVLPKFTCILFFEKKALGLKTTIDFKIAHVFC